MLVMSEQGTRPFLAAMVRSALYWLAVLFLAVFDDVGQLPYATEVVQAPRQDGETLPRGLLVSLRRTWAPPRKMRSPFLSANADMPRKRLTVLAVIVGSYAIR